MAGTTRQLAMSPHPKENKKQPPVTVKNQWKEKGGGEREELDKECFWQTMLLERIPHIAKTYAHE